MLVSNRCDTLSKLTKALVISISIHETISSVKIVLVPLRDGSRFEKLVSSLLILETSRLYSILRLETGIMLGVRWCEKQVSERIFELAHWCQACDPSAPIKKQHKWLGTTSDTCAAHRNVWDTIEFFCKSTRHGRFRDSSDLSGAAVAALTAAHN